MITKCLVLESYGTEICLFCCHVNISMGVTTHAQ